MSFGRSLESTTSFATFGIRKLPALPERIGLPLEEDQLQRFGVAHLDAPIFFCVTVISLGVIGRVELLQHVWLAGWEPRVSARCCLWQIPPGIEDRAVAVLWFRRVAGTQSERS